MPPKPFPLALTIGTDILHLPRLKALLTGGLRARRAQRASTLIHRFVRKVLCGREVARLDHIFPGWEHFHNDPKEGEQPEESQETMLSNKDREGIVRWLGGRWAVKEAARKAVGAERCGWKDVLVKVKDGGRLECVIRTRKKSIEEMTKKDDKPFVPGVKAAISVTTDRAEKRRDSSRRELITSSVMTRTKVSEDFEKEKWGEDEGTIARCSISHDGDYVTAVVLAAEESEEPENGESLDFATDEDVVLPRQLTNSSPYPRSPPRPIQPVFGASFKDLDKR